jgi:hypothetical protein
MRLAPPICLVAGLLIIVTSGCLFAVPPGVVQCQPHPASRAAATTYYVDAARGRDSNPGTTPATAWRTLARVDRNSYRGGDTILLRGGQRFAGTICLGTANLTATSQTRGLMIASYGRGRATIFASPRTDGIAAINVAGVRVSGVNVVGRRDPCRKDVSNGYRYGTAGIRLEARALHGTLDQGIILDHADVSRFCNGIVIASDDDESRISHVRVTGVRSHDNGNAGVWTYDQANARHSIQDVRVTSTRAYRNNAQGGIVLFGVDGGTVANSVAFANARGAGGGVGIWAFDSNRILFVHNESFRNGRATISDDGDGFDFDQGVSNSVMEHNYSHGNGGVGFLVCSCNAGSSPFYRIHDVIIRSNLSRNDGSSGQPSLYLEGGAPMTGVYIASNRVESGTGRGPLVDVTGCLYCDPSYMSDVAPGRPYTSVRVRRNAFVSRGGKPLLQVHPGRAADLVFQGNSWRAIGSPFRFGWGQALSRATDLFEQWLADSWKRLLPPAPTNNNPHS